MPITNIKADIVIPDVDGMPKDEVVNTLAFAASDTTGMTPAIADLFNGSSGAQAHPLAYYINASRSRVADACEVRYYDVSSHLDGTPSGAPFQVDTWTLGASAGSTPLPDQVCAVVSFYSALNASGETTGRHRGRIFLGPLDQSTGATDSFGHFIIAPAFAADVGIAFNRFIDGVPPTWSVWSRAAATMEQVIGGFINEQFDTQRRRRIAATSRVTWAI